MNYMWRITCGPLLLYGGRPGRTVDFPQANVQACNNSTLVYLNWKSNMGIVLFKGVRIKTSGGCVKRIYANMRMRCAICPFS